MSELKATASTDSADAPVSPKSPVKPALKKGSKGRPKKAGLTWDEAKIEEHDKLRGTRMKIEEPNTPYNHAYDSGSETDGSHNAHKDKTLNFDHLSNKLEGVAAARDAYPMSPGSSTGGEHDADAAEQRRKEMKELEFREHRKRHYNEMELVRRFREQHPGGLDDEDDDNDADDET